MRATRRRRLGTRPVRLARGRTPRLPGVARADARPHPLFRKALAAPPLRRPPRRAKAGDRHRAGQALRRPREKLPEAAANLRAILGRETSGRVSLNSFTGQYYRCSGSLATSRTRPPRGVSTYVRRPGPSHAPATRLLPGRRAPRRGVATTSGRAGGSLLRGEGRGPGRRWTGCWRSTRRTPGTCSGRR